MKTTLNIPEELVKRTMKLSKSKTKTAAIIMAMEEYVRRKKLEDIIGMKGKLRFSDDWGKARHER
ncbi:MAG: type II toxin-antitoxin system VapB family antitoxin [Nitrospirota bacterium]